MNADLIALSLPGFWVTTVCTATRTYQELAPFAANDMGYLRLFSVRQPSCRENIADAV
jgi:hypothetical protein